MASDKDTFKSEYYFPTMLFVSELHDASEVNSTLANLIRAERAADAKGVERSNIPTLGGWHSQNNLHHKDEYAQIVERIKRLGAEISTKLGYDPGFTLEIDSMWSIINGPGSFNRSHIHPGSLWSGVYYVAAPEKAGSIEFVEPRTQNLMTTPKYIKGKTRPVECWGKVQFDPVPGKMIVFPSWLYHSVNPNLSNAEGEGAERVIISFNLSQVRT